MPTYAFPDDESLPPSTPDKVPRFDNNPSTTPAGPPPSSAASFTPAGAPSDSYLGSSMMRNVTTSKPAQFGGAAPASGFSKNLFGSLNSSPIPQQPLGRSIETGRSARKPSGLSQETVFGDSTHSYQGGTFHIPSDEEDDDEEEEVDEVAEADEEMKRILEDDMGDPEDSSEDAEGEDDDEEDLFLGMHHRHATHKEQELEQEEEEEEEYEDDEEREGEEDEEEDDDDQAEDDGQGDYSGDDDDYEIDAPDDTEPMDLATPAATERMRKEAQSIFRASNFRRSSTGHRKEVKYATMARNLYTEMGFAYVAETPRLVLRTEDLINRLYDEGIGIQEDPDRLDESLSFISASLNESWAEYAAKLPLPQGEDMAGVGPSQRDEPFRKAAFVADLVLRLHRARLPDDQARAAPLTKALFEWAQESSSLYRTQVDDVLHHQPSPACHGLYWQTLSGALLRGDVNSATKLLREAGWKDVKKGARGEKAYTGQALENVQRAAKMASDMLDMCPGKSDNWDIFGSDWTLFRIQAKGSLDKLQRFAEGKDRPMFPGQGANGQDRASSLAQMARKAESQVPWDIYEHLQGIFEVAIGVPEAILEIAQDWSEATVGLFGWWETSRIRHGQSLRMSRSQTLALPQPSAGTDAYFDRLAEAFHIVVEADFHFNSMNPVEVAIVSAFEGNFAAVVGFLRAWSLPVASAVAELASLGNWLPKPESPNLITLDSLDMEDLDILGVKPQGKDETEGVKDTTLVQYARELAGIDRLDEQRDGWEVAIQVLGRMDSAERSEEMVGELLRDILDSLDADSSRTVDKLWRILNNLGMIQYAEETAETFAEILANSSHRYGEALWYYALAHRPGKVREVLNLLMSYSLIQSTVFPPANDLDDHLHQLLTERTTTLEQYAKQDLEAAQLLGRMLSGYATLRKFYEIRDTEGLATMSSYKANSLRRQAATALVAVIASSDDNIRGGLYDETRDAVVSEDFLLALLGEALPFINRGSSSSEGAVITLDQMDTLLKAVEDIETVSPKIFDAANEFFKLVLASAQGLKGSSPHDLMQKSTSGLSGSSSYVLSGSSMLASRLHRSVSGALSGEDGGVVKRGWDWRGGLLASASSRDVLSIMRLGLARDLSSLWLAEADNEPAF